MTVKTKMVLITRDDSMFKYRCIWLPADGQQIWLKRVGDRKTNKKEYCATSWFWFLV